jgi:hypothetical protein
MNEMFGQALKIKEVVDEGKGNIAEIPYRNEVVFAITDTGQIKIISYECNEPSFLGDDEITWNEEGEVNDESMWNKIYKSVFFADFTGDPQDGDVDGGWSIDLESSNCKALFDLNTMQPTKMTLSESIEILKRHNKWRRGDDTIESIDSTKLGIAIDIIIEHVEKRL